MCRSLGGSGIDPEADQDRRTDCDQIIVWHFFRLLAEGEGRRLTRIHSVPIAVGFQIHYMNTLLGSADKSWNSLNSTIWDQ